MIAVLGAAGQLGSAFMRLLGPEAKPVTRDELDFTELDHIAPWIDSEHPDLIINCAAYTNVDRAESHETVARMVNATAVGEIARAAERRGADLVTFSTDYVFDGSKVTGYVESDPPNPLSAYGRTKLEGEELALEQHPGALVVRTSWVISGTHDNFVSKIIELMQRGPVEVVNDQRGHPTITDDLAGAALDAIEMNVRGILHLTNRGETTWHGLATDIADLTGLQANIRACTSERLDRPAPRPVNSVLDSERSEELGIPPLPHYRQGLEQIVTQQLERQRQNEG